MASNLNEEVEKLNSAIEGGINKIIQAVFERNTKLQSLKITRNAYGYLTFEINGEVFPKFYRFGTPFSITDRPLILNEEGKALLIALDFTATDFSQISYDIRSLPLFLEEWVISKGFIKREDYIK